MIDLNDEALAEFHGAVLLHYDSDYEHITAITGQPQTWVPKGTADSH